MLRSVLALQDPVNIRVNLFQDHFLLRVDGPFLPFTIWLRFDHGQAVFQADHIAETL